MRRALCVLSAAALGLVMSPAAFGVVNNFNVRPVGVGPPPAGEQSLQMILDQIYGCSGCVNAFSDQQTAAKWMVPGVPPQVIAPVLQFEFAGNADVNAFGFFSGTNPTALTARTIFKGPAEGKPAGVGEVATVTWLTSNSGTISSSDCAEIDCGTFTGIDIGNFGFFLKGPDTGAGVDGNFWTPDDLNPAGGPQALTYRQASTDKWVIAFEDRPLNGGADGDHNDLVVSVESIIPVPEPTGILLLGTALLGCAKLIRRVA